MILIYVFLLILYLFLIIGGMVAFIEYMIDLGLENDNFIYSIFCLVGIAFFLTLCGAPFYYFIR